MHNVHEILEHFVDLLLLSNETPILWHDLNWKKNKQTLRVKNGKLLLLIKSYFYFKKKMKKRERENGEDIVVVNKLTKNICSYRRNKQIG